LKWFDKFCWYFFAKPYECPFCKKTIYEDDKFCKACGSKIGWEKK